MGETSASDQIWSPICGVTLERYAELTRELAGSRVVGPEAVERWAVVRGVRPGSWIEITAGWSSRMIRFAEVRRRFDQCLAESA